MNLSLKCNECFVNIVKIVTNFIPVFSLSAMDLLKKKRWGGRDLYAASFITEIFRKFKISVNSFI